MNSALLGEFPKYRLFLLTTLIGQRTGVSTYEISYLGQRFEDILLQSGHEWLNQVFSMLALQGLA